MKQDTNKPWHQYGNLQNISCYSQNWSLNFRDGEGVKWTWLICWLIPPVHQTDLSDQTNGVVTDLSNYQARTFLLFGPWTMLLNILVKFQCFVPNGDADREQPIKELHGSWRKTIEASSIYNWICLLKAALAVAHCLVAVTIGLVVSVAQDFEVGWIEEASD